MAQQIMMGIIQEGKLIFLNPAQYKNVLETLNGYEVDVIVKKHLYTRTLAENRYYWGVIVKYVADAMYVTPDEAHEFLKGMFLKVGAEIKYKKPQRDEHGNFTGESQDAVHRFEVIKSTADLDVQEFEKYCEQVRMWAMAELNTRIPEPNEDILED